MKEYYDKSKQDLIVRVKTHNKHNAEQLKECNKQYYAANKEELQVQGREHGIKIRI